MNIVKNIKLPTKQGKYILTDVFYKENDEQKPVIIFAHGIKCFKDWGTFNLIAEYFAEKGFIFVKFNFSHNGTTIDTPDEIVDIESFANNNIQIELSDLDEVIGWVSSTKEIPENEIRRNELNLVGHSRGGSLCILQAANDNRIKTVTAWSAFNDFEWVFDHFFDLDQWKKEGVYYADDVLTGQKLPRYYQHYENYLSNKEKFNIRQAIESIEIPVFVMHGTEDEMVPFEHSIEMKRWNKNIQLSLVPNGSHRYSGIHPFNDRIFPFETKVVVEETYEFLKERNKENESDMLF